jgi:hypothetical protein
MSFIHAHVDIVTPLNAQRAQVKLEIYHQAGMLGQPYEYRGLFFRSSAIPELTSQNCYLGGSNGDMKFAERWFENQELAIHYADVLVYGLNKLNELHKRKELQVRPFQDMANHACWNPEILAEKGLV